jgi:hypothetical protein
MLAVIAGSPTGGSANGPRPQDFQKIRELINKFIVNTAHLMNAFAATCEDRLAVAARSMHRVECQVALLEYKLDSIDRENGEDAPKGAVSSGATKGGAAGGPAAITAGPGAGGAAGKGKLNLPLPGGRLTAPKMPAGSRAKELPVPGAGGPPVPVGLPALPPPPPIAPGAPPLIGAPPQPPPMPMTAGLAIRTHPQLLGYFRMQQAGVAVVAIKAKMRADGFNPDWFDTPDAPSPIPAPKKKENEYDSD